MTVLPVWFLSGFWDRAYHVAISVLSVVLTLSKKCGIVAMGLANFPKNLYETVFRTYSENRYKSSKYKEVARQESASVSYLRLPTEQQRRRDQAGGAERGGRRKSVEKKRKYIFMKGEKESSSAAASSCSEGMFKSTSCDDQFRF